MRLPRKGETYYARNRRPGFTNRIVILRIGKRTVRLQHVHDDGRTIRDGDCPRPARSFLESWSHVDWGRCRRFWRLKPWEKPKPVQLKEQSNAIASRHDAD